MFAALGNPAKLHIIEHLVKGPASVNDIAKAIDLKQSMTSQHLSSLLAVGAVVSQEGWQFPPVQPQRTQNRSDFGACRRVLRSPPR